MLTAYGTMPQRPLGDFTLPAGLTPDVILAAAGAISSITTAVQDLSKTLSNFKLHIEHDVNVKLPPSGEFLARALPPAIITTAFIAGTAFLIGALLRRAHKPYEPRATRLHPAVSGIRRRRLRR